MFMDSAAFSDGEDVFSGLNRRGTFMMKRRAIRRSNVCMASLVRLRGGMAGGILVRAMCNSTDAFEKIKQFLSVSADRKSTRLNSSHANISYAVFCLKKKN